MNRTIILIISLLFAECIDVCGQTIKDALAKEDTIAALALIKSGSDINAIDNYGTSLLMNECRWGQEQKVSFLLRNGATVDMPKSPKGRTALMVACAYYSGKTICNMLIERGADVNAVADGGVTPLMLAAQNAKLDVVEILLNHGANRKATDVNGKTAYDYADKAMIDQYLINSVKDTRIDKAAVLELLK